MVEFRFGDCPPDCIVAASQTTSWVTARGGQMYSFGKLKKTGDCAMYPVPFYDLQGWGLRSVACGQAIYAAAGDDQAITWGQGSDSMALNKANVGFFLLVYVFLVHFFCVGAYFPLLCMGC